MNLHGRIAMTLDAAGGEYHEGPLVLLSRHFECGEAAASNERTASLFEMPGLDVRVHSVPAGPGDAGGDVHYVSLCPGCLVSRIALADAFYVRERDHYRFVELSRILVNEVLQTS